MGEIFLNYFREIFGGIRENMYLCTRKTNMVPLVQLVRASDCGSECPRFESVRAPKVISCRSVTYGSFFYTSCFRLRSNGMGMEMRSFLTIIHIRMPRLSDFVHTGLSRVPGFLALQATGGRVAALLFEECCLAIVFEGRPVSAD